MSDQDDKTLLREIHTALVGNEALGQAGIVKTVRRHEEWISQANQERSGGWTLWKFVQVVGGLAVGLAVIYSAIHGH